MDEIDDRHSGGVTALWNSMPSQQNVLSRDLKPCELNTDRVSLKALSELESPHPADRIDSSQITKVPDIAEEVAAAANKAGISTAGNRDAAAGDVQPSSASSVFEQHPVLEGINAALLYERRGIGQLNETESDSTKQLNIIDSLLDLSTELTTLKDKDKHELSEKMQSILSDLKEKGVDLFKADAKEITKEQLIELKSVIGSHIDKSRTKVQQIFTRMQTIIQNMMSVNDSSKRMINEFIQLLRTITKNMRP